MSYNVDSRGLITDPGKFEREPLYVPAFWERMLEGWAYDTGPNSEVIFHITETDRQEWPELQDWAAIVLWETDNGFVNHSLFRSLDLLQAAIDEDTANQES